MKLNSLVKNLIIFTVCLFFAQLVFTNFSYAQESEPETGGTLPANPDLQVPIDAQFTAPITDGDKIKVSWTGQYLAAVYKYLISIVGTLAAVVIMYGGFLWVIAAGNKNKIDEAKLWILGALSGLLLALTSYTILYYINPDLVKFKPIEVNLVKVSDSYDPSNIGNPDLGPADTNGPCIDSAGNLYNKYEPCKTDDIPNGYCFNGECLCSGEGKECEVVSKLAGFTVSKVSIPCCSGLTCVASKCIDATNPCSSGISYYACTTEFNGQGYCEPSTNTCSACKPAGAEVSSYKQCCSLAVDEAQSLITNKIICK